MVDGGGNYDCSGAAGTRRLRETILRVLAVTPPLPRSSPYPLLDFSPLFATDQSDHEENVSLRTLSLYYEFDKRDELNDRDKSC